MRIKGEKLRKKTSSDYLMKVAQEQRSVQFIFNNTANTVQWEEEVSSTNFAGQLGNHMQKNEVGLYLTSYTKIKSK